MKQEVRETNSSSEHGWRKEHVQHLQRPPCSKPDLVVMRTKQESFKNVLFLLVLGIFCYFTCRTCKNTYTPPVSRTCKDILTRISLSLSLAPPPRTLARTDAVRKLLVVPPLTPLMGWSMSHCLPRVIAPSTQRARASSHGLCLPF